MQKIGRAVLALERSFPAFTTVRRLTRHFWARLYHTQHPLCCKPSKVSGNLIALYAFLFYRWRWLYQSDILALGSLLIVFSAADIEPKTQREGLNWITATTRKIEVSEFKKTSKITKCQNLKKNSKITKCQNLKKTSKITKCQNLKKTSKITKCQNKKKLEDNKVSEFKKKFEDHKVSEF